VRHENDPINNTSTNQDNQDESINDMPLNNSKPIIIKSMNLATHSNMETTIDADLVDTFKDGMKFLNRTDPRFNQENQNNSNLNPPDLNNNIPNIDPNVDHDLNVTIPLNDNPDRKILIKDFFLNSRLSKFFPHLFVNYALDYTHIRKRKISEKEAIDKMIYNYQGIYTSNNRFIFYL
jgi:hypothetical protein